MEFYNKDNKLIKLLILFIIITIISLGIKSYFQPFGVIIILFLLSNPLYKFMSKFFRNKFILAFITLITINVVGLVIIIFFGNSLLKLTYEFYNNNSSLLYSSLENIKLLLKVDGNKLVEAGTKAISISFFKNGAVFTTDGFVAYIIGNVSCFFMLCDKDKIYGLMRGLFSNRFIIKFNLKKDNLREVLKIEALLILISTIIITIGFMILRIPNSIFLGIICGILDVLPYVGTIIVFIPIIIYNILTKNYLISFGLILLYLLVQIIREILEAKFLSKKLNLHPLIIMVSIYIGIKIFGLVGMVIGPIYCILAKDIIDEV